MNLEISKTDLLATVQQEKIDFTQLADKFYQQTHRSRESYVSLCEAVIKAVDRIEASGDWQQSTFLKNSFDSLKKCRDQAQELYMQLTGKNLLQQDMKVLSANQTRCFISLYQSQGHDLKLWALQLMSIENHIVGRPIYRNEDDVQKVMRLKLSQTQEAYAVLAVENHKIIEQGKKRVDRIGNELLTLPAGSVKAENVLEFVHLGRRYMLNKGVLVLKNL